MSRDVDRCLTMSRDVDKFYRCLATSIKILAGWGASLGDDDDNDDDTDLYINHIQERVLFDEHPHPLNHRFWGGPLNM